MQVREQVAVAQRDQAWREVDEVKVISRELRDDLHALQQEAPEESAERLLTECRS